MARQEDRTEIVLAAAGCPQGRHLPPMRACAWREDQPCWCRVRIAIEDIMGGRVEQ